MHCLDDLLKGFSTPDGVIGKSVTFLFLFYLILWRLIFYDFYIFLFHEVQSCGLLHKA